MGVGLRVWPVVGGAYCVRVLIPKLGYYCQGFIEGVVARLMYSYVRGKLVHPFSQRKVS